MANITSLSTTEGSLDLQDALQSGSRRVETVLSLFGDQGLETLETFWGFHFPWVSTFRS